MVGFHNNSFNPQTLVVLETAFDEAWLTLKSFGGPDHFQPASLTRYDARVPYSG